MATIYASRTMAHGHEAATEVVGTNGRLVVGRDGRLNHVEIADAHGRIGALQRDLDSRLPARMRRLLARLIPH